LTSKGLTEIIIALCCACLAFGRCEAWAQEGPHVIVLGIAQDGGVPQAGTKPESANVTRRHVASLAIVDPRQSKRWLIDCTPDFPEQLLALDRIAQVTGRPGLAGVFLTHAHMGHYTGLMFLGHEVMGARGVPVFATAALCEFLATNGPWSQLVRYENIVLNTLVPGEPVALGPQLEITPFAVPHRQEYSDVVGYRIDGPERSVLFIPDIDSWWEWDANGTRIEDAIRDVAVAYLDGTFYANGEIPGRDMSTFPHPFITTSMERFASLPPAQRAKVRFIHLNHTNPALVDSSAARAAIEKNGFRVAEELERVDL
jgi:pyrroloquinoline quinone biosynthesis protein B